MDPKSADVIGGFNRFLDDQRKEPGVVRMMMTHFSTDVEPLTPAIPLYEVPYLTPATYTPGGNTALLDAVAQAVRGADREARPEDRVLCLVITDGEENSSRETTFAEVQAIIHEREARGNWTFAYLGAAPERWSRRTGTGRSSSLPFSDGDPRASFMRASDSTRRYRSSPMRSTRSFFAPDEPPPASQQPPSGQTPSNQATPDRRL
jgi:hypothetical protein